MHQILYLTEFEFSGSLLRPVWLGMLRGEKVRVTEGRENYLGNGSDKKI